MLIQNRPNPRDPAMTPHSPHTGRGTLPPRLTLLLALAAVAVLVAVLQRTALAPLPHAADDFVGGVAVGLAVSAVMAWFAVRD